MPQSPTDIFCWSLPSLLLTDYIHRYLTESSEIFTAHATITDGHSIGDYHGKYRRNYFVSKVLAGIIFLACLAVCKTVGAWFFFISNKISDGMGNYRQSIFRRTYSVGEAIGKTFTDDLHALHRRNE